MESGTLAVLFVVLAVAIAAWEIVAPRLVVLPFGLGAGTAATVGLIGASVPVQLAVLVAATAGWVLACRRLAPILTDPPAQAPATEVPPEDLPSPEDRPSRAG